MLSEKIEERKKRMESEDRDTKMSRRRENSKPGSDLCNSGLQKEGANSGKSVKPKKKYYSY